MWAEIFPHPQTINGKALQIKDLLFGLPFRFGELPAKLTGICAKLSVAQVDDAECGKGHLP